MQVIRKRGFVLASGLTIHTSQTSRDTWIAWIEEDGQAICLAPGKPLVFEGSTRYQAQCEAARWARRESA